jgi:hypothetical protein
MRMGIGVATYGRYADARMTPPSVVVTIFFGAISCDRTVGDLMKKEYSKPELRRHGLLRELTRFSF